MKLAVKYFKNIYKEKCDEGDGKACFANIFMSRHSIIIKLNGAYGFINKNGKIVLKPKFDKIDGFSEGLTRIKLNGKWGIIDKNGKFIIEPKFDDISYFEEGLAKVKLKWRI
ncbi:WG repeat-containing protein [Campylobacter novaezeelandiae]|uniref:WG repeat-containing protein n=1 Tax=Campylobacter novaezeelandiae TaxID=2267891 RepID=UPI0021D09614